MTSSCFEVSRLVKEIGQAFEATTSYLRSNSLPSAWSLEGRGWQELLDESQKQGRPAGFYASCDGLLVLSYSASWTGVRDFAWNVYRHSLCPVFDGREATTTVQTRMREQVLPSTMKLARFLCASTLWRAESLAVEAASAVARTLEERGSARPGEWPASTTSEATSLAGTAEALHALAGWHSKDHRLISPGIDYLVGVATRAVRNATDRRRAVVAIWALSPFLEQLDSAIANRLARTLLAAVETGRFDSEPYREDFFLPSNGHDYYTYDTPSLGAAALLRFCRRGVLSASDLRMLMPYVSSIATCVRRHGLYSPDRGGGQFKFWCHHQAMRLLADYRDAAAASLIERDSFMLITPKVFPIKNYKVDKKLAVVLMPFREDWSSDVYKVLRDSLRLSGFKAWRSDAEHKDDVIVESIWEYINKAAFVIADCTTRNPNVFYELGLAHVIGKSVFICAQRAEDIPFDIKAIRYFSYSLKPSGVAKLRRDLAAFAANVK